MDVLSGMQAFVKVVDEGSFTKAAASLSMPKSTLSRHVAALEDRLGVRLLHRTTRSLRPTDVGMAYYERCTQIVNDVEEAEAAVTQLQTSPRGTLRLSVGVTFGYMFVPSLISSFLRQHDSVDVEVQLSDRMVDLVDEGFDLALRAGVLGDSSLIARKLGSATRACVASPEYLRLRGTPKRPSDLRSHDCLRYGYERSGSSWGFASARVPVSGPLTANNADILREAAIDGLGLAFMPRFMVAQAIQDGTLVEVLAEHIAQEGGVYAVYPHSRHLSAKVRAFVDHAIEHFGPIAPWDQE